MYFAATGVAQVSDDITRNGDGVLVVSRQVVRDAALARMHQPTAERLLVDVFSGRGLHERWTCEENAPLFADDDVFVRHGGNVSAACDGDAVDDGDLGNPERGHLRL